MRRALVLLAAVGAVVVVACNGTSGGASHTQNDRGILCVFPPNTNLPFPQTPVTDPVMFPADAKLLLRVEHPSCFSSSCQVDRVASCSTMTSSNTITVSSVMSWRDTGDDECTSDCGFLTGTCETEALAAGTYTLEHGTDTLTVEVGATQVPPCTPRS